MSSFAKLAIAAVAVIAIGTAGIVVLQPSGGPGVGAIQSPSPRHPSPTRSPTPTASPSPTPAPTAAPLSGTFTSPANGISIAHPEGWSTRPATVPWITGWPNFGEPFGDFLFDPVLNDHLFIALASQPLAGTPGDQWAADILPPKGCGGTKPVTIDGASGLVGVDCNIAAVAVDGRGYLVMFYTSADDGWLDEAYDRAWFERLLTTIVLRPEDIPSASPSP